MRHRRASRDVASFARPRASSSESSESPHAYFANASSIADDMSRSHRARRAARAREWNGMEWNGGFVAGAGMDVLYTKIWSFRYVLFFFVLFCARPPVRSSSSSSSSFIDARAIRFDSVRFDSTRHARGRSRAVLARARADVRLVATTMRDVIGVIFGGIHVDRTRARETRWTREEARDGGGWVSIRCGRACESERERERETRRDDGG